MGIGDLLKDVPAQYKTALKLMKYRLESPSLLELQEYFEAEFRMDKYLIWV